MVNGKWIFLLFGTDVALFMKSIRLPLNGDSRPFLISINEDQISILLAENKKITGKFHIHFTVIDNFIDPTFFPPLKRNNFV